MSEDSQKGFYEVPEALQALKKRYQELGFMLTGTKQKSIEKSGTLGKRWWLFHMHISLESMGWDMMTHTGHVLTHWFSVGRERVLVPGSNTLLCSTYLFVGPVAMLLASVKLKEASK